VSDGHNIRELQGRVDQMLGVPSCVLQIQSAGSDLIFRVRYPLRLNDPKKGPMLTTEYRLTNGVIRTKQDIVHELPELVEISLVMAFTEVIRRKYDWPLGWPVPSPQAIERVLTAPIRQNISGNVTLQGEVN
jgi:hypothetical protein